MEPTGLPKVTRGGPRVEQGRQSSDSGQPPLPASEVRDVAGPSQAQSGGRRAPPEAPSLAGPPRPPGAEALGWAGGGTSGGGASWLPRAAAGLATSPPGRELAGRAAAPRAECGTRRRAQGRAGPTGRPGTRQPPRPPQSFQELPARARRARGLEHERVPYPRRPEPPPGHDLAPGEDLEVQVLHR